MSYNQQQLYGFYRTPGASLNASCSGQMCLAEPPDSFTVEYTYDKFDDPDDIWTQAILPFANSPDPFFLDLSIDSIESLSPANALGTIMIKEPSYLNGGEMAPLSGPDDAKWYFIVRLFSLNFGFSPNRIVNVSITPFYVNNDNTQKVTSMHVKFTIANYIPNIEGETANPTPDPNFVNDDMSAICLGGWIIDMLNKNQDLENLATIKMPKMYRDTPKCRFSSGGMAFAVNAPSSTPSMSGFTTSVRGRYNNISGNINHNKVIEKLSGVAGEATNVAPATIIDYVFMFAYFISFLGAIFFSMASIVNIDPATLIANKNVSFALNLFIGICGAVSLFVWINIDTSILKIVGLNPSVVAQTSSSVTF